MTEEEIKPTYVGNNENLVFIVPKELFSMKSESKIDPKVAKEFSKCIRGNTTALAIGRTKSEKELDEIAEECGAEVSKEQFLKVHNEATKDSKYDFLFIDFHKKDNHPSMFRKNLNEFIIT